MTDPKASPIVRQTTGEDTSVLTLLRGLRWTLFTLGLMALGVTVLFLFLRLPAVIVPGLTFIACYILWAFVALLEHSARFDAVVPPVEIGVGSTPTDPEGKVELVTDHYVDVEAPPPPPVEQRAKKAGNRGEALLGIGLIGVLLLVAIVAAALAFGRDALILGTAGIFIYLALAGGVLWLAATQQERDDAGERVRHPRA